MNHSTSHSATPSIYSNGAPGLSKERSTASASEGKPPAIRISSTLVIFAATVPLALLTASECSSVTHLPSLGYGMVLWLWWGCVASILWKVGARKPSMLRFSARTAPLHLLAACALGSVHLLLLGSTCFMNKDWAAHGTAAFTLLQLFNINRFGLELLLYGFIVGIAGIVHLQVQAQREAMRSIELQQQLSAAHLQALQMQLEPHFLFNTLNAITTLVELGRQQEAAETLSHLNAILKTTLKRSTPEKIPLSQELEMVENYLAIEQIRFADRLKVEIKVDPNALDGLVPCFLLQPIVENAIRHGISHREEDGIIHASIERSGNRLHLRVRDNGPGLNGNSQPGHGIGLRNTEDRLSHFYPKEYGMNVREPESGGFEVSITVPYERKPQ